MMVHAPLYMTRIPKPDAIPVGLVVVHNHVKPTPRLGSRGFRAWLAEPADNLEICECGWAPELAQHYRVRKTQL